VGTLVDGTGALIEDARVRIDAISDIEAVFSAGERVGPRTDDL
jgi:hypothetical protein